MAVNRSRSQNAELEEGVTDGTYKKIPPDRSVVENPLIERHLDFPWRYGFEDAPRKMRPDAPGLPARRNPSDHG
jgi:hypothetical protein